MPNIAKEAAALCALLANENRLMILYHLSDGPMNVGELHKKLKGISQSALSQHLSLLRANRIVECDKQGQNMVYHIIDPRAIRMMGTVRDIFFDPGGAKRAREDPSPAQTMGGVQESRR